MSIHRIQVLDCGYVEPIESWGSDASIVAAARMSTQKGFLGWGEECGACGGVGFRGDEACRTCKTSGKIPGDEKLLRFLYENGHSTPFEMAGLIVEVQAPIFVFREWHRHRTQGYSEMSARYAPLPDFNYVPTVERCMATAGKNKQAVAVSYAPALTEQATLNWLRDLGQFYDRAEMMYQNGLANGVPKELARIVLPVGRYSRMRATACLRNWMHFMTLRSAPNAQHEIRVYSDAIGQLVSERFPRTWELFAEGMAT